MEIKGKSAVITGGASGIGLATAIELAKREVKSLGLVDRTESVTEVAAKINRDMGRQVAVPFVGDVRNPDFRAGVFRQLSSGNDPVRICVPAAGVTRDRLSVKIAKDTGEVDIYPLEMFRLVTEVDLIAPVYWALELVAGIAHDRRVRGLGRWEPDEHIQGTIIFIGSISSLGNKGQIAYAASKAGLEGAAATMMAEAIFHGVRCGVIHPGFTDTPMVRAMGDALVQEKILPHTQLRRLIRPEEIADAICFMIANSAVSGQLWADAGWHPTA
jgi:3-oxoacyl-[acyl-carrier protein] reductase